MDKDRLEYLLQRYLDQLLVGDEWPELEQMLRENRSARETFWERAQWHGAIRAWGQEEWGRLSAESATNENPVVPAPFRVLPQTQISPRRIQSNSTRKTYFWPIATAAALILGALGWFAWMQDSSPKLGIAVLTRASSSVWEGDALLHPGQSLQPGTLHLKSGACQIEFARGARLVIEGPADFRLVNENEGYLDFGKLRAKVPEAAHGFKVGTPRFEAVDLGTEFACLVPKIGADELHVFQGEIIVDSALTRLKKQSLKESQAIRIEGKIVTSIPADSTAFMSEEELAETQMKNARGSLAAWRESSRALAADPRTLLYLDFEAANGWERTLKNRAVPNSDASIIGSDWAEGRWPGKNALEFQGNEDRVRLSRPALLPSFTMAAWIRVADLANTQNSLLMGESFAPGETHWYLCAEGRLGIGVRTERGWSVVQSEPVIRPEMMGSWIFVSTVYDGATRTATHYLNGRAVASGTMPNNVAPRLDTFEIGNYGVRPDDPRLQSPGTNHSGRNIRSFHGRIDELAVLTAPLRAEEIRKIYLAGRPNERAE